MSAKVLEQYVETPNKLNIILNNTQYIFICSLMRDAEKLMSRCIYLNILKATISVAKENETSSETLEK